MKNIALPIKLTLSLSLSLFCFSVFAQLNADQIQAFRSAKTARIEVAQEYGAIKGFTLPFNELVEKLVKFSGLEIAGPNDSNFDLKICVNVKGRAKSGVYKPEGTIFESTHYTGASLSGMISFEQKNVDVYQKEFSGEKPLDFRVVSGSYTHPFDAPFEEVFPDFFISFLETMHDVYAFSQFEVLNELVNDENYCLRFSAIKALGELTGPQAEKCLIAALQDKRDEIQRLSAHYLGQMKSATAVKPLIPLIWSYKNDVSNQAILSLGNIGDPRAITPLTALLRSDRSDRFTKQSAVRALKKLGANEQVFESLMILSKNRYEQIRIFAITELAETNDPRAVEPLIEAIKIEYSNENSSAASLMRNEIITFLAQTGDPRAIETLVMALNADDRSTRKIAEKALIDMKDPQAVEPLLEALRDKDWKDHIKVITVLDTLKDPRAIEPLITMLQNAEIKTDDDRWAFQGSVRALKNLGVDTQLLNSLMILLKSPNSKTRSSAFWGLRETNDPRAVEPLIGLLNDENNSFVGEVIYALGEFNDPRAVEPLIGLLNGDNNRLLETVINALGKLNDPRAIEPLILLFRKKIHDMSSFRDLLDARGFMKDLNKVLQRITGTTLGGISDNWPANRQLSKKWEKWWKKNKGKYI